MIYKPNFHEKESFNIKDQKFQCEANVQQSLSLLLSNESAAIETWRKNYLKNFFSAPNFFFILQIFFSPPKFCSHFCCPSNSVLPTINAVSEIKTVRHWIL